MDYYFPGTGNQVICRHERALLKSGTNEPWLLLQILKLHILVGFYAQRYYLQQKSSVTLTETVKHYQTYLPQFSL